MPNDAAILGRNRAKGMISTAGGRDKIPSAPCRLCGRLVYFTTDGSGELLAWERDWRTLHEHQDGA